MNFRIITNAHYHSLRRAFYLLLSRSANFLVILSGTAGVASVLGNQVISGAAIGFLTAVLGTVHLVFDLDGMVRKHESLQKQYYELAANVARSGSTSLVTLKEHKAALLGSGPIKMLA